jgi:hypothetical protein
MKQFRSVFVAAAVAVSAGSAMADTCFYEESINGNKSSFAISGAKKDFAQIARNRLTVIANSKSDKGFAARMPTARLTCFNETDGAPTVMQYLDVYLDERTNSYVVRETGL